MTPKWIQTLQARGVKVEAIAGGGWRAIGKDWVAFDVDSPSEAHLYVQPRADYEAMNNDNCCLQLEREVVALLSGEHRVVTILVVRPHAATKSVVPMLFSSKLEPDAAEALEDRIYQAVFANLPDGAMSEDDDGALFLLCGGYDVDGRWTQQYGRNAVPILLKGTDRVLAVCVRAQ